MELDDWCKYLAERHPASIAAWLLNVPAERLGPVDALKTELSSEPIRADHAVLIRHSGRILHVEFQVAVHGGDETPLPLRMLDYWVRYYRRYRVPVDQVVVLFKRTRTVVSDHFQVEGTSHRFRVIRMWEEDPQPLLADPALLPLATLAQTSDRASLLGDVAARVDTITDAALRQEVLSIAQLFAGHVATLEVIRAMFRERWMKESVVYKEMRREGREEGREEGRIEGREEGLHAGASEMLIEFLEARWGPVPVDVRQELERTPTSRLKQLGHAAAVAADWTAFREALAKVTA